MTGKLLLATVAVGYLALFACNKPTTSPSAAGSSASTTTADSTSTTVSDSAANNSATPRGPPGTGDLGAVSGTGDASSQVSAASATAEGATSGAPASSTAPDASTGTGGEGAASPTADIAESQLVPATTAQGFAQRVAMSDQFEIQSSQLALQRPVSPELRSFAHMMIADHGATSAKLEDIAAKDSIALPGGLTTDQQSMLDKLRSASDTTFSAMYIDDQVKGHEAALKLLKSYAVNGDNADLKQFATETAPKVQQHLTKADALGKAQGQGNPS